ncbi:sigma-70 family RNA polymerase sigma factor [Terrabacter terrigena]|uniref:Sigma-70 family RNA polymerase sigma factor n=1 Tax=Terrabacter terrigena TaxID=574718 RepID=A0ABW3MX07_9MICO
MAFSDSTDPAHLRPSFAERDAETTILFQRLSVASGHEAEHVVEEITLLYLDLCTRMAARYDGRGIEHDDLVQVARLALVKAIRRYEPGHAPSFAAYAVPTISGELKRWFRDRGWVVRPPRRLQELRADVNATRAALEQQSGSTPSDAQVADAVGSTVAQVREVDVAATGFSPLSLDCSPADDDRPGLEAFLACDDHALESADDRVCLTEALTELDDGERELLLMRYVEGMTQREIGDARGISQMQVSRTLRRITVRLHDHLVDDSEDVDDTLEPPLTTAS